MAARDTLVEGCHRLVRRTNLQLLVVRSVVAAAWARGIRLIGILPRICATKHVVNSLPIKPDLRLDLGRQPMDVRARLAEEAQSAHILQL